MRGRFRELLAEEARLLGRYDVLDELEGKEAPRTPARPPERPTPAPVPEERPYPPADEVAALWRASIATSEDAEAAAYLRGRGIEPAHVDEHELARVIPRGAAALPSWAMFKGDAPAARPWTETGHRLLVPAFDATGAMRGVRAWRILEGDTPKRLPPSGYRAAGLVLADTLARWVLEHGKAPGGGPLRLIVAEGEPDFLTWASRQSDADDAGLAVVGVVSGAWTTSIAARIPDGTHVAVRTHHDEAGRKYAAQIQATLAGRCRLARSKE